MLASVIGAYVDGRRRARPAARSTGPRWSRWSPTRRWRTRSGSSSGFFLAFAIKAPLVPLHTWLPDAGRGGADRRRPCCWSACWTRSARSASCATCLPMFPEASTTLAPLVLVLARGRHPLRRAARDRAARHEAVHRLRVDRALRLHRARHLRVHDAVRGRRGDLHGQPLHRDRHADPGHRHGHRPRRLHADRRLRRHGQAGPAARPACSCSPVWPRCRCPARTRSSASSWC